MFEYIDLRKCNFRLLFYTIALSVVGILVIQSATINSIEEKADKQVIGLILGLICMVIVLLIDYHWLLKLWWAVYIACIGLLLSVHLFGVNVNNAKRWIKFPVIGQFQPSEVVKIGLIVFFAAILYLLRERINKVTTLLLVFGSLAIPLGMILAQPNLSTSLVIIFITLCMVFTAGISYKWILGAFAVSIPALGLLIYLIASEKQTFLEPYQVNRIMAFVNPKEYADLYYQQENSIMAISSGMLWGKGLNNTTLESVKNGNFLVEAETDFIFAVVGEELGFVGGIIVIVLLALIVFECFYMAAKAMDMSGRLICTGMAALIGFQGFANIAVATGLFPNTGLPLPFVSYGVTSLISLFMGIGLVMNVGMQGKINTNRKS